MPPARHLPFDPVNATIARYRAAFEAFQIAPDEGETAIDACDEYDAAGAALIATPCATRFGALALLAHLRWWLAEEAEFAAGHHPSYGLAAARAGGLAFFLCDALPPAVMPTELPPRGRHLPPQRRALDVRRVSLPLMIAGEALAAAAIVVGAIVTTGFATLL